MIKHAHTISRPKPCHWIFARRVNTVNSLIVADTGPMTITREKCWTLSVKIVWILRLNKHSSQSPMRSVTGHLSERSSPSQLVMFNKILSPKFDIKSATLPNRKYGARVAQKKAMYESLTLESLSSMSTSSIEYSRRQEPAISRNPSSDFSDKVTPFCYTRNGYKTLADKDCQTENADPEIDKVNTFWTDMDDC